MIERSRFQAGLRFPFFEIGQDGRGMANDTVGGVGRSTIIGQKPKGRMKIVVGPHNLSSEVRVTVAMNFQDEFDDIGDLGEFGLVGVRVPFRPVSFCQLFGGDLFQPFACQTSGGDAALKSGDYRRRRRYRLVLVCIPGRYLEHGFADDAPHVGRDNHSDEPAMALLGEIRVARPDHGRLRCRSMVDGRSYGGGQTLVNLLGKISLAKTVKLLKLRHEWHLAERVSAIYGSIRV